MLYLLHFKAPVGKARHYLGATTLQRFRTRMREHASGYGAVLTSEAFAQDSQVFIVRTWDEAGYEAERQLKKAGHFKKLCPVCSPERNLACKPAIRLRKCERPAPRMQAVQSVATPLSWGS